MGINPYPNLEVTLTLQHISMIHFNLKTILIWCNITMLENDLISELEFILNIIKQLMKSSQQEENYTSAIQISLSVNNPVVKDANERVVIESRINYHVSKSWRISYAFAPGNFNFCCLLQVSSNCWVQFFKNTENLEISYAFVFSRQIFCLRLIFYFCANSSKKKFWGDSTNQMRN